MTYNAADRKDVRRAEKSAKLAEVNRREFMTNLMSTGPGRAWMWDKLEFGGIFRTTFTGDALSSAHNEGIRAFALTLLADIMAYCPETYILMTRESNERRASSDRAGESTGGENGPGGPEGSDLVDAPAVH